MSVSTAGRLNLNGHASTAAEPISRTLRELPISQLRIDGQYQRDLDTSFVAYLVKNWDPEAVGVINVAERGAGGYHVTDGQHRVAAMEQIGWTHALCDISPSRGVEHEAQQFFRKNKQRPLQLVHLFRALYAAGDKEAHEIVKLAKSAGWTVQFSLQRVNTVGTTCAIATLEQLYRRNAVVLFHSLRMLLQAWPEDPTIGVGKVIRGMFLFLTYGGDRVKPSRFVKVMSDLPLRTVIKRGDGLANEQDLSPALGLARQLAVEYNRGLKPEYRVTFDAAD